MPCAYSAGSRSSISTCALTNPYPLAWASRTARPVPSAVTDAAMYCSVFAITVCRASSNRGSAASMSGVYLMNGVGWIPPSVRLRSGAVYDLTVGCDPLTIVQDVAGFIPKVGRPQDKRSTYLIKAETRVRNALCAGGKWIRTPGPAHPVRSEWLPTCPPQGWWRPGHRYDLRGLRHSKLGVSAYLDDNYIHLHGRRTINEVNRPKAHRSVHAGANKLVRGLQIWKPTSGAPRP